VKILLLAIIVGISFSGSAFAQAESSVAWKDALKQTPQWYATPEAARIADNLLVYQLSIGGWPKNTDMATPLSDSQRQSILTKKTDNDSTIDNGATFTQLAFLARVHTAKPDTRYRDAFIKGVDYLLKAQYSNGGWPQYYPDLSGYYKHITYNDDAMIGVMKLLRDIAAAKPDYVFVDSERRAKAGAAVKKGIECILKTQIIVEGKRTVWCAQHDEVTFAPARARTFELVSLSGGESVSIVRFLMSIAEPSPEVILSIKSAIEWFEKSKLVGIKWVAQRDSSKPNGFDRVVVNDPTAGPLWARFYEISGNRPIFVGRDGITKYSVAEIEAERRNGYAWYIDGPADLLSNDYPRWLKKHQL
jgi:PelA/Pel-15E family pectate lyase